MEYKMPQEPRLLQALYGGRPRWGRRYWIKLLGLKETPELLKMPISKFHELIKKRLAEIYAARLKNIKKAGEQKKKL